MFGAVLSWAAYTLIGKRVLVDLSPLAATTVRVDLRDGDARRR
jgi:hypothetical protein